MDNQFKALLIREKDGEFIRGIADRLISDLPDGDVLIRVKYSSINYKDALSASGNKGVTKKYPHTPGIDAAGIVEESSDARLRKGDSVIVTGYDLGMNTSGGFGQYIRVPADWVVKLPENLSLRTSMVYGTAGFTAALCILKLLSSGLKPDDGEILVTGATGGVGSTAVSILSKIGFSVTAASGKSDSEAMLTSLGAKKIISRSDIDDNSGRPLLKGRWAGAVDTVGGNILATVLKTVDYGGAVACCGNVASIELNTTVFPFILRGVTLFGIDSVQCPMELRLKTWDKIANEWMSGNINDYISEVSLSGLGEKLDEILAGKVAGRVVVDLS